MANDKDILDKSDPTLTDMVTMQKLSESGWAFTFSSRGWVAESPGGKIYPPTKAAKEMLDVVVWEYLSDAD